MSGSVSCKRGGILELRLDSLESTPSHVIRPMVPWLAVRSPEQPAADATEVRMRRSHVFGM